MGRGKAFNYGADSLGTQRLVRSVVSRVLGVCQGVVNGQHGGGLKYWPVEHESFKSFLSLN